MFRMKNSPIEMLMYDLVANQTGGPAVPVTLGRRDSLVSLASNVRANIIDTGFSVVAMAASFAKKGLSLVDLVTLSGTLTNALLESSIYLCSDYTLC
jgi:hypothetical protein